MLEKLSYQFKGETPDASNSSMLMENALEPEGEASCENDAEELGGNGPEERCQQADQNAKVQPPDGGDDRRICPSCGRQFNPSSWERHQRVCQQVFRSTRPQFDAMKGTSVRVPPSKQETQLRTCVSPLARIGGAPPRTRASASRLQHSDRRTCVTSSVQKIAMASSAREKSPKSSGLDLESIEHQEQRVMNMLQQQLEELRDMRRQCDQVKEATQPIHREVDPLPNPSRRALSPPKPGANSDVGITTPASSSPGIIVGSSAASSSQLPRHSFSDRSIHAGASESRASLKLCENCGRSFNPTSFEKHHAVCRAVFGKPDRTPFESHRQRLRSLQHGWDCSPPKERSVCRDGPPPTRANESGTSALPKAIALRKACTKSSKPGATSPVSPKLGVGAESRETSAHVFEEPSNDSALGLARLTSPQRALKPCPFCGRSFRAAAFDKHAKVCQSVFPTHDARIDQRHVYDSRRHRLKGTAFEAYRPVSPHTPPLGDTCNATPPMLPRSTSTTRSRGSLRSPKPRLQHSASESQIPFYLNARSTSPLSPHSPTTSEVLQSPWPRHFRYQTEDESANESDLAEGSKFGFLNEASQLLTKSDIVSDLTVRVAQGLSEACQQVASTEDYNGVQRFLEDRRGKLERARLDVKISQRPEYSALLGGSSSEKILRRASSFTWKDNDSVWEANFGTQGAASQPSADGSGGSSGIDFRSHYERCLEHLDSIGGAQLGACIPESIASLPLTCERVLEKPELVHEDLGAGCRPAVSAAAEESFASQPTSIRTPDIEVGNSASSMTEAAMASSSEQCEQRVGVEGDGVERSELSIPVILESLAAQLGVSRSPTPAPLTPCQGSNNYLTDDARISHEGFAPQKNSSSCDPPVSDTKDTQLGTPIGDVCMRSEHTLVDTVAASVQTTSAHPIPSVASLSRLGGADLPSSTSVTATVSAQIFPVPTPIPCSIWLPVRNPNVPRLDLRKVSQAKERRVAQAQCLQASALVGTT